MDQTQYDLAVSEGALSDDYKDTVLSAATIEELAEKTGCKPETLKDTIESFNTFAEGGKDYKHNRGANYMRAFDGKMYYAMPMSGLMLNTQGGPRRNENAEVLDTNGNRFRTSIPRARWAASPPACIRAAQTSPSASSSAKSPARTLRPQRMLCLLMPRASRSSLRPLRWAWIPIWAAKRPMRSARTEYVSSTAQGMMGNVVTRVTVQDGKVAAVEVLEQTETEGIGTLAINELPGKFVGCATAEEIDAVDSVSGATITSNALKEAVKAALASGEVIDGALRNHKTI